MKFNGNITLNALGQSEVQNLVVERLASTPAFSASEAGRLIYNTTARLYYMNSGLGWVALATGGDAASLQSEVDALETSIGAVVTSTGEFNPAALGNNNLVNVQSLTDAINQLDAAVSGKDELKELADVAVGAATAGQFLRFDLTSGKWVNHTLVLANVTDVTATATEVNFLAGVTSNVQGQFDAAGSDLAQAEADLNAAILAEKTRAEGIEAGLRTDLTKETTDRAAADTALSSDLAAEVTRATNAEGALQTAIDTEATARSDADAALQAAITAEEARATGAEGALSGRITTEVADRTAADTQLAADIAAEAAARESADDQFQLDLDAEITARAAGDTALSNKIDAAIAGLTWENAIDAIVTALPDASGLADGYRVVFENSIYTVTGGAFGAGEALVEGAAFFDKETDVPYVFNGTSVTQFNGASGITAGTGLVKDGNTLNIVSSSGTITVTADSIDVSSTVLGSITTVQTNLDAEVTRATTAETGLGDRIDDEIAARQAADTAMEAAYTAAVQVETDRAVAAEGKLTSDLAAEVNRAQAAESANTTAIATEKSRAETAEASLQSAIDAEVARATGAEQAVAADLSAEVTRAQAAEGKLTTDLASEVSRAQAAEAAISAKLSKGYHLYDGAAASSHTVAHGIGSQFCNVTVIDSATNEQIIPQSVVFDSASQLTVTFNVALACKVVVMGLGA